MLTILMSGPNMRHAGARCLVTVDVTDIVAFCPRSYIIEDRTASTFSARDISRNTPQICASAVGFGDKLIEAKQIIRINFYA